MDDLHCWRRALASTTRLATLAPREAHHEEATQQGSKPAQLPISVGRHANELPKAAKRDL
eukprot:6237345-Prorocentrum_lima.AAC.1